MKKIDSIFPEIFNAVTFFHVTIFTTGKRRPSCAATSYRFRRTRVPLSQSVKHVENVE